MYNHVKDDVRSITSASGCPKSPGNPSAEGTCDDSDGWPEGHGMVKRSSMGKERLDYTVYTWQ
jgi:hypothetical protein